MINKHLPRLISFCIKRCTNISTFYRQLSGAETNIFDSANLANFHHKTMTDFFI